MAGLIKLITTFLPILDQYPTWIRLLVSGWLFMSVVMIISFILVPRQNKLNQSVKTPLQVSDEPNTPDIITLNIKIDQQGNKVDLSKIDNRQTAYTLIDRPAHDEHTPEEKGSVPIEKPTPNPTNNNHIYELEKRELEKSVKHFLIDSLNLLEKEIEHIFNKTGHNNYNIDKINNSWDTYINTTNNLLDILKAIDSEFTLPDPKSAKIKQYIEDFKYCNINS